MSLSPLQQQQQQQQQASLLNFNQLTIQTNDYANLTSNSTSGTTTASTVLAPIGGHFKSTTSPLNNLLNTSPILNQQQQQQQVINNHNDEEMSTSSSASSTHSISSSSNSSIKDEHLLTLSPLMTATQQQQQHQLQQQTQRNINSLLSSTNLSSTQIPGIIDLTNSNKCDLCKELIINNTKLLWGCYHVYCQTCIERLQLASSPSTTSTNTKPNTIICPLCSQEIRIVDTLTNDYNNDFMNNGLGYDFSLNNLLNDSNNIYNPLASTTNTNQKFLQTINKTTTPPMSIQRCQNCKSNDLLIQKCFTCFNQLCQNCLLTHQYIHYFDLKDMILDTTQPLLNHNERLINCFKHKTEQLKYFCSTCNQLLCKECVLYDPHTITSVPKHDYGLIQDLGLIQVKKLQQQLDQYKLQLQTILTNDSNNNLFNHQNHNHHHSHSHHHSEHNLEQIITYLNNKYQKAINDVDNMYQFYKQLLDERKQELKAELDSIYHTKQILINNLLLTNKNDENLNNIKFKIDNIINFTQKLMKNNTNLNELLLIKKPIEQKLQLLLQQLALITNDINLNKFNKELFNIEFVTNYSTIQPTMLNTFGYLKYNMNIDLVNASASTSSNTTGTTNAITTSANQNYLINNTITNSNANNGYKPKPIGPPISLQNGHRHHHSPKLNDFGGLIDYNKQVSTSSNGVTSTSSNSSNGTNGLHFNDLLTFESWSNGINTSTTTPTNLVSNNNDLSSLLNNANTNGVGNDLATLQAEQLLDLTTSSNASTQLRNANALQNHHATTNGSHNHHLTQLQSTLPTSILPARSQLKRQKMIYNCKFGEFGINDGQFTEPSGVAINQTNDIIVADTNSHRIQIFDRDGHFKFKFGECGKREGQLLYPNRVSIVKQTGDIIVTERSPTHQIQIYNQYGHFIRKFGANILQHPRGVCVDSKGNIIVVECKVMRVIIFDQNGNVVHKFSCSKYLEFPNGVCVNDKQEIFISDNRAHCIKVFNYEGQFLRQIGGEGITNYPIGVGINSNGEVLVADNHNNFNLTVFTQDGQLINALESKVKHAQCFDVGLMDDGSIVLASKDYRIYVYRYISTQTSPLATGSTMSATNTTPSITTSSTSSTTSSTTATTTSTTAANNSTLAY